MTDPSSIFSFLPSHLHSNFVQVCASHLFGRQSQKTLLASGKIRRGKEVNQGNLIKLHYGAQSCLGKCNDLGHAVGRQFSMIFHTSCNNFCPVLGLQGCLHCKQPWNIEIMSQSRDTGQLFFLTG